jgi:CRP-like cAMP-binding protein
MNRAQHQMMKIVQKIPVFDGLSLEQAERLIQISRFRQYESGDTVYDIGETSDEMLVLIKGKLSVLSAAGQTLGEVPPGKSTGEMGVFTGHDRSATIVATEPCAGLAVTRVQIYEVMNADAVMKSVILENVVSELSDRLVDANTRLDVLSSQVPAEPEPEPEPESEPESEPEEETTESDMAEEVIAEAEEQVSGEEEGDAEETGDSV